MSSQMQLIAIAISLIWIGALIFYLYSSRQHRGLSDDIRALQELVDKHKDKTES